MSEQQGTPMLFFYSEDVYEKFMDYLTFKAEVTLLNLLKADDEDITWYKLMTAVNYEPDIRSLIGDVIFDAVARVIQNRELTFKAPDPQSPSDEFEVDIHIPFNQVYSYEDRAWILLHIIHFTEKLHYEQLFKSRNSLSFEDYIKEAEGNPTMTQEIAYGFTDAIRRMGVNIQTSWTDERIEDACEMLGKFIM